MSTRTQAALLIDTHHPLPEPLIPDGTPKETDTEAGYYINALQNGGLKNISGWGATESAVIGAVSGLIGGEVGSSATLDDLFNPESLGRGTLASLFSGINYNKAAKEVWRAL